MHRRVPASGHVIGACAALALLVAGCAGGATGGRSVITVTGKTLTVFASQPPEGGTAVADTLAAERLALAQAGGKVGSFNVKLVTLHGRKLSDNARSAIQSPTAIAYLGEQVPGTSQISVAILNQEGVLEVSPADTAAYLTQPIPPVSSSPTAFFPGHTTYKQTFARVVGNTGQEAKALVAAMQAQHPTSLYTASDGSQYGAAAALQVRRAAQSAGLSLASGPHQAQAYFYGASAASVTARDAAARVLDQEAAANPNAQLYVPSGLYDLSLVSSLSPAAQRRLYASSPGFMPQNLPPAGKAFSVTFARQYGHRPAPAAIFGYEAMSALLAVLAEAKSAANQRATVVAGFRSLQRTGGSVLGPYAIRGGDPSVAPFVIARVRAGQLVPFKFVSVSG